MTSQILGNPSPDCASDQAIFFLSIKQTLREGSFNINVSSEAFIGADGEIIEPFLGNSEQPIWEASIAGPM